MITIKNSQRAIPLSLKTIKKEVQHILELIGYPDYDIGIWFTGLKTIHHYNKTYRHKDKPTDVLSFAYHPNLKPGQKIKPLSAEDKNLGDLIVAPLYVKRDAEKKGISFQDHLRVILIHGICHLLGYDHIEDKDFRVMRRKEVFLLKKLTNK